MKTLEIFQERYNEIYELGHRKVITETEAIRLYFMCKNFFESDDFDRLNLKRQHKVLEIMDETKASYGAFVS